ncbi:hypothetical protein D3C80_1677440 [compost metagenome]
MASRFSKSICAGCGVARLPKLEPRWLAWPSRSRLLASWAITSVLPVPVRPPTNTKSHWSTACRVVSSRKVRIAL